MSKLQVLFLLLSCHAKMASLQMVLYRVLTFWLCLAICCIDWSDAASQVDDDLKSENEDIRKELTRLGRQLMLQQFFAEERVRSEGSSGRIALSSIFNIIFQI